MQRSAPLVLALALVLGACAGDSAQRAGSGRSASPSVPSASPSSLPSPGSLPSSGASTASPSIPAPPAAPSIQGVPVPKPGTYVYAQQGTEQFCTGTTCGAEQPLAPQATATIERPGREGSSERLIATFRIDEGRLVRLHTLFSGSGIALDKLDAEFTEAGVSESGSIRPTPAVPIAKLPYRPGAKWNGAFRDGGYSGTYSFTSIGRERISARGSNVEALRIDGTIDIEGDASGSVALSMWLDPATNLFLRLKGTLDFGYGLTRYKATFTDTLTRSA